MVKGFCEMVASMVPSLTSSSVAWSTSMAITMASCGLARLKASATSLADDDSRDMYAFIFAGPVRARYSFALSMAAVGFSLHVKDLDNLDSGIVGKYILVSLKPLLQVGLARHGEEDDVAFAVQVGRPRIGRPTAPPPGCWCR